VEWYWQWKSEDSERYIPVFNATASYSGGPRVKSRLGNWLSWLWVFAVFLSPSVPYIGPLPLLLLPFQFIIHLSSFHSTLYMFKHWSYYVKPYNTRIFCETSSSQAGECKYESPGAHRHVISCNLTDVSEVLTAYIIRILVKCETTRLSTPEDCHILFLHSCSYKLLRRVLTKWWNKSSARCDIQRKVSVKHRLTLSHIKVMDIFDLSTRIKIIVIRGCGFKIPNSNFSQQ
jgi:hypothetical protein